MMKRIGMPASDDTILRHPKPRAKERRAQASVRVVGIDDWAWRKGSTYGTIIVDLERREEDCQDFRVKAGFVTPT